MERWRRKWIFSGLLLMTICSLPSVQGQQKKLAYFNGSAELNLSSAWSLRQRTGLSFRTCSDGTLLDQTGGNGSSLKLHVKNGSLAFTWKVNGMQSFKSAGYNLTNNTWYYVELIFELGILKLRILLGSAVVDEQIISNSSYNRYLWDVHLKNGTPLQVGHNYKGCIMPGPNVILTSMKSASGIEWDSCPLNNQYGCSKAVKDINDCWSSPCKNGGTCIDGVQNYTCRCLAAFNGSTCEQDLRHLKCALKPCKNNATCLNETYSFKCVCPPGFTGLYCEDDINECLSAPCSHGSCVNFAGGYQCNCSESGYELELCAKNIDECINYTCGKGSCIDTDGSFICECYAGYTGHDCLQEINECSSSPCQNGGTCRDQLESYACNCSLGFRGDNCETNINDCDQNSCTWNNTKCVDLVGNFSCVCKSGFSGQPDACLDIDECKSNPCKNNATCVNLVNMYHCDCVKGFNGTDCENDIDECWSQPCENNATCVNGIDTYTCQCLDGFEGKNCSTNIDDCISSPCYNGICQDEVNAFSCRCHSGWTGNRCETDIDECLSNPCQNGATCDAFLNFYNCTCLLGFTDPNCGKNIDDCYSQPCQHNGTCVDLINDYFCNCSSDWMGKNCSEEFDACFSQPCYNNATCNTQHLSRDFNCSCALGFTGDLCETNIDDCKNVTCNMTGEICHDGINSFVCSCPKGMTGDNCSTEIDECMSQPCQNNATCINGLGEYSCKCKQFPYTIHPLGKQQYTFVSGFNGTNCEHDINECNYLIDGKNGICLNGGTCINFYDGYECNCDRTAPDGNYYSGFHCDLVTNYCSPGYDGKPPCLNNGTCTAHAKLFTCACIKGFNGSRCDFNIDDCAGNPCRHNGTCEDGIDSYKCSCPPGTNGTNCEIDIDECSSNPCQNGGQCLDRLNGFTCNCFDTGFNGSFCGNDIDDCVNNTCENNATCIDGVKAYNCSCYLGYFGDYCEHDVDECLNLPCQNGGTCIQRSNKTLYGAGSSFPGFQHFSYATASGYFCHCTAGYTGQDCEDNIDECQSNKCINGSCVDGIASYTCNCSQGFQDFFCDKDIDECATERPCQHESKCINTAGSYLCECLKVFPKVQYGGKNCSIEMIGCQNNSCMNGATCEPYLLENIHHNYFCHCQHGFTGKYCTNVTTLSFDGSSMVIISYLGKLTKLSLQFQTTLPEGIITAIPMTSDEYFTVEIQKRFLYLTFGNQQSQLSKSFANVASWHEVVVSTSSAVLAVDVTGVGCLQDGCHKNYSLSSNTLTSFGNISIGNIISKKFRSNIQRKDLFIGCMRDITVNGNVFVPASSLPLWNITTGCPREKQCKQETCNRKGNCTDLWNTFHCQCNRPYLGESCESEIISGTFSHENKTSWLVYSIPETLQTEIKETLKFSFFIITRQSFSQILYLGNNVGTNQTYLSLKTEDGKIRLEFKHCKIIFLSSKQRCNDGMRHYVEVTMEQNELHFIVDSEFSKETLLPGCDFVASILIFGQRPAVNTKRRKRSTVVDTSSKKFKAVLQDVQLNNFTVMLFFKNNNTLSSKLYLFPNYSNVDMGVKTDDLCAQQPCKTDANCSNVVYNDFRCNCSVSFWGKDCGNINFCLNATCPNGSICANLSDGYECLSEATFVGRQTVLQYIPLLNDTSISNITLEFRTRNASGILIYLKSQVSLDFIKVSLIDNKVKLEYHLNTSTYYQLPTQSNDGKWHKFVLTENSTGFNVFFDDEQTSETIKHKPGMHNMSFLTNSDTRIFVGGDDTLLAKTIQESYFKGCMKDIRIGGILLPFFDDSQMKNNPVQLRFSLNSSRQLRIGCHSDPVCNHNGCRNNATCHDIWNEYNCTCLQGFNGSFCEENIDDCVSNNCTHGASCVDGIADFTCSCVLGYEGQWCEVNTDDCISNPCKNNGTCFDLVNDYNCTCLANYTGQNCSVKSTATCADNPCKNGTCNPYNETVKNAVEQFNCSCLPGYTGKLCETPINYCQEHLCQNGATCHTISGILNYTCACSTDWTGHNCENRIKYCAEDPCGNNGNCTEGNGTYHCSCFEGWSGSNCTVDIDECKNSTQLCERGMCVNTPGQYHCNCTGTGYKGANCSEQINECLDLKPCQNDAVCVDTDGNYVCNCTLGYQGKNCDVANCADVSCINTSCSIHNNKWSCDCPAYYEGQLCEHRGACADSPCSNNSSCTQNITLSTYSCHCQSGYEGQNCSQDIDECANQSKNKCANGATCTNNPGSYVCVCMQNYFGKWCQVEDLCKTGYCKNGANCTVLSQNNVTFVCGCLDGWKGETCAELVRSPETSHKWLYIGLGISFAVLLLLTGFVAFLLSARKKRATRGAYNPSRQEMSGSRVELGNVLKLPPQERLI